MIKSRRVPSLKTDIAEGLTSVLGYGTKRAAYFVVVEIVGFYD